MRIGRSERLECPVEFQQHLTDLFGVNVYGDPLFKIYWGQTEAFDVAAPGGYTQKLYGHNQPCWMIMRWRPPELFGTPDIYYALNADPETGLALMGEYPEMGTYEPLIMLMHKYFDQETNELIVKTLDLDWDLIEKVIPALEAAERMTPEEIKAAEEAIQAQENAAIVDEIERRMESALPTFYGPTSHAARLNKTSLIDQKKQVIEKEWKKRERAIKRGVPRGFYQEKI